MKLRGRFCLRVATTVCAVTVSLAVGSGTASAQPTFELMYGGADEIAGAPGSTAAASYNVMLAPGGDLMDSGAQGWSISATADGASIVGITTDGTIGADVAGGDPGLRNGGFEKSETTSGGTGDCEGLDGAVSAVVLSFTMPITAPIDGPSAVASVAIEADIPAEGEGSATLDFADGCQGAGQPVSNNVTWMGQTVKPSLTAKTVALVGQTGPCVGAAPGTVAVVVDAPNLETPEVGNLTATFTTGTVVASIDSNGLESGVQGWSLSVGFSGTGAASLDDATTDGTAGADVSAGGLRNGGFEKTELVDPLLNEQGAGAVSAVVLSFTMPITLEATSTSSVLALSISGDAGDTGAVRWVDGLQGAGQPVSNVATIAGSTENYFCQSDLDIIFDVVGASFLRGNANGDARLDIADPIWIINELFREGPATECAEAGDANDDDLYDLSDATYLISYLFEAGSAPPGDGLCELETDPELCAVGQDICQ